MKSCRWSTTMLLLALCIGAALAAPSVRVKRQEDKDAEASATGTNPVGAEDASISDDLDRDKRKAPSDPKFEAKNAILGFVFGASNQAKQALKDAIHPTRPPVLSTTDDTPDFNRMKVSLQVPDALFGSTFTLVTSISTRIGNLIMSTARRTGEILWVIQPLVGKNLTIEIPTTTTTTPRTTTRRTTTTTAAATTSAAATSASTSNPDRLNEV
ncbi:uncharacterized protein LOC129717684 isoform X1 [Wyeomyia smithii]|uniref:uncharacterized protein LOC129717684 isoform X1 n=1 Tax=Wyeomyia smithii TaxID=174621 RepID=UPI002468113E|nr:uncharacterized protein LOC129717684 isoform X1 [Wyeomyia smithii]XP_055523747.1 uncharacterized protein LOC129717684 isoform X1 [Wyeomyia smithii]XP_055523748.1 uncharacterized protein LOC129717684 isoform X1 [Wyeomyia smithii]